MGAMTAVMVGLGAMQAGTQIIGGMQQRDEARRNAAAIRQEADYNAGVYEEQAKMIDQAAALKAGQDARAIRFASSRHYAVTAAKGIEMSGSAMAVYADTMTQMELDKAITQYNYEVQKYGVKSQAEATRAKGYTLADMYRRKGDTAMFAGIMGGLTTIAQTGFAVALRNTNTGTAAKTDTDTSTGKAIDTTGGAKRGSGA